MTPWAMLANSAAWMPVSDAGGQGEGDEAHVRHRRVGDQPLEVALDQAGQRPPDDADDAGDARGPARAGRSRRARWRPAGAPGRRCPSSAARPPAAPTRRWARWCGPAAARCAAGTPAPSPTGPSTSSAATSSWRSGGQRGTRAGGERPQVGGAGRGDQGEDADQHQRGAERRVEDEAVPRRRCGRARRARSPNRLISTHIGTRTSSNATKKSTASRAVKVASAPASTMSRQPRKVAGVPPAGTSTHAWAATSDPDERGEQHQRHGDAVDAERPAHAELGQPRPGRRRAGRWTRADREHEGEAGRQRPR